MPRPPGLIDKVNYIIDFVEDPCEAPWIVYVETMLPALGNALMVFIDIDPIDIIRAWARPGGLGGCGFRLKRKSRKKGGGIPDINEVIGKNIPGARSLEKGREISKGFKFLWKFDGFTQRLLWYWLLVDVISDSLYIWTSLLNQTEFCSKRNYSSVSAEGQVGGWIAISGWLTVDCPHKMKQRGNIDWFLGTLSCYDAPAAFRGGAKLLNIGLVPWIFEMKLVHTGEPDIILAYDSSEETPPGAEASCLIDYTITKMGVYQLYGRISAGFAQSLDEMIFCQATLPKLHQD